MIEWQIDNGTYAVSVDDGWKHVHLSAANNPVAVMDGGFTISDLEQIIAKMREVQGNG